MLLLSAIGIESSPVPKNIAGRGKKKKKKGKPIPKLNTWRQGLQMSFKEGSVNPECGSTSNAFCEFYHSVKS